MKKAVGVSSSIWMMEYQMDNKLIANKDTSYRKVDERPFGLAYTLARLSKSLNFPNAYISSIYEGSYAKAIKTYINNQQMPLPQCFAGEQGMLMSQIDPDGYTFYFQTTGDEYELSNIFDQLESLDKDDIGVFVFNDDFISLDSAEDMIDYLDSISCPIIFAPYLTNMDEEVFASILKPHMIYIDLASNHEELWPNLSQEEFLQEVGSNCQTAMTLTDTKVYYLLDGKIQESKKSFSSFTNQEHLNVFAASYALSTLAHVKEEEKIEFAIEVTNIYMKKKGLLTDFDNMDIKQKLTGMIIHG